MELLRTLIASLGTTGAVRNAELALLARQAEDRAIDTLVEHLAVLDRATLAPAA